MIGVKCELGAKSMGYEEVIEEKSETDVERVRTDSWVRWSIEIKGIFEDWTRKQRKNLSFQEFQFHPNHRIFSSTQGTIYRKLKNLGKQKKN